MIIPAKKAQPPPARGPEPFRLLEAFEGIAPHQYTALETAFRALPWRCDDPFPMPIDDIELVIVRGGLVAAMYPTARGREVAVALLEPGDVYPPRPERSGCRLVPIQDAWISLVPPRHLATLLTRAPAVGMALVRGMTAQLDECARASGILCEMRVEDRLMGVFHKLAMRHGVVTSAGVRLTLMLSHSGWGTLVGASREAVTAALLRLRRRGEVACTDGWVILPHASVLESPPPEVLAGAA